MMRSSLFIAASLMAVPALAQDIQPAKGSVSLTIYSTAQPGAIPPELYRPTPFGPPRGQPVPGYAIVRQEREVNIANPRDVVRFTDVAAYIDPTTVSFASLTDPETRVLEQNFEFDLVSTDKLMEKFIDQQISVTQVQGDDVALLSGKLLSTQGGLVLQKPDGQVEVVSHYANVRFPQLPGGLITRPTLVWDVATAKPGVHNTRVTYQTEGMTWWADYNAIFTEGKDANSGTLDFGAWVSIINQSGASYPDAKLKLIAGDVHRAPKAVVPLARARAMAMEAAADAAAPGFEEKSFFEYHLYTLGHPTTLPQNSTKQIELFPTARNVPVEKVMVYYGLEGFRHGFFATPALDRNIGVQSNKKVDIYLKFKNAQEIGMGMPLPSGRIRVSKLDPADQSLEFIGEDKIDHTPRNEEVLIKMGSAFDVVGERKQLDFNVNVGGHVMEETIEVTIRNHKDTPVKVLVRENLYRWVNWEIREKTHEFEKVDARTIHFPVRVDKDGTATVRYKVRYTW